MFRRAGVYRRLKSLLQGQGLLEQWHDYERAALCAALREWARAAGFEVVGAPAAAAAPARDER